MTNRATWVLLVLLCASVTLNVVLLMRKDDGAAAAQATAPEGKGSEAPAAAPPAAAAAPAAPDAATAAPAAPAVPAAMRDWQVVRASVEHSIARTISTAVGEYGDAVAAEFARLFVWDVDMTRDLSKGDELVFAWRLTEAGDYQIAVARLKLAKHGKTLTAYRFQLPGDDHPSYWRAQGEEVPLRLEDGPLRQYEQITSLLKDRPTHKGMDFKVPVGTPVHSPRAGVVTRTNWNWKANGNAVELKFDDGVIAKFLHLSANKVEAGQRVTKGQVVALTGNTGITTAPHLHYQLERGPKIVDPLEYHRTVRRKVPGDVEPAFRAEVERLDALLAGR